MKFSARALGLAAAGALTLSTLSACYQMGDVQDIAACQAFAAAQSSYDSTANDAMANPDDKAKQVAWLGSWGIFVPGIDAAAKIPNTPSLKKLLGEYAAAVNQAGVGASKETQIAIWNTGMPTKIVSLCNELAAPIKITDLKVQ